MTGWVVIISAAAYWEARALRGHCPTLSYVLRRLPLRTRWIIWWLLYAHFLREKR